MQESSKVSSSGLIAYAILSHVFGFLAVFFGIMVYVDGPRELWRAISYVCLIPGVVFNCLILHRGWKAVQDGKAQTTPGKAVGFLFIPFFNLYWGFVAWYGLMQEKKCAWRSFLCLSSLSSSGRLSARSGILKDPDSSGSVGARTAPEFIARG
jgi:hypothetical protein